MKVAAALLLVCAMVAACGSGGGDALATLKSDARGGAVAP